MALRRKRYTQAMPPSHATKQWHPAATWSHYYRQIALAIIQKGSLYRKAVYTEGQSFGSLAQATGLLALAKGRAKPAIEEKVTTVTHRAVGAVV